MELNPMQLDLQAVRLNPQKRPNDLKHLMHLIGIKWEPLDEKGDVRPAGWGWEQQEAYGRLFDYYKRQSILHHEITRKPSI